MWLLDHNLPIQLRTLLQELGVVSETAVYWKWDKLRNGDLVSVASHAGFDAIITRDVKFSEAAKSSLLKFPKIGIVVVRLPQRGSTFYLEAFRLAWKTASIIPISGKVIFWP